MSAVQWGVKISGVAVAVADNVIKINRSIDNGRSCAFTVVDATGTADYGRWEPVEVKDETGKVRFSGFVHTATDNNLNPSTTNKIDIECYDQKWRADKAHVKRDYENELSGDIVADLHNNALSELGVSAKYAQRRDTSAAQWALGTLSNAVGVNNIDDGDLELPLAGVRVNATGGGSGFNIGNGLMLTGYASSGYSTAYVYRQIWTGSMVIANNDVFAFDVWIDSASPQVMASVNFTCSDGTTLNITGGTDNQGLSMNIKTDLSGLANDQWYSRSTILVGSFVGKTITSIEVALGGVNAGTYTAYFRRILYGHFSTGLFTTIFGDTTQLTTNQQTLNNGYSNVSLKQVRVVDKSEQVQSFYVAGGAKIVKDSQILYDVIIPDGCTALAETSIDGGASWQVHASSGDPVANLLPGMVITGRNILYRYTLTLGSDPTAIPSISTSTLIINSAYNSSKSDVIKAYTTATDFVSGTLTDLKTVGSSSVQGIVTNGFQWNYDTGFPSQTGFGTGGSAFINKQQYLNVPTGVDFKLRMDFAGLWSDFVTEVDIYIPTASASSGIVYRTTGWQAANNTYGYAINITTTMFQLGRGTNTSSGAGSFTSIASPTIALAGNSVHRLKVIAVGSSHQIFLDGVRLINATDSTYLAAGNIGLRTFNNSGATVSLPYDNFGVCSALTGTWSSPSISLAGAGSYGNSVVAWDVDGTPDTTCSITAQTSIDGGATYQAATNGGPIAGLTAGQSLTGKSLLIKMTLTASNAPIVPTMNGVSVWVMGQYSVSGSRISPAMSLSPVGIPGSTSLTWNGLQPANTTLFIDAGPDGSTWTNAGSGASGSVAVPGITTQPDPIEDSFDEDTHSLYTSAARSGGSMGVWTFNTAQSRIDASGSGSVLLYAGLTSKDVDIVFDTDMCNRAGVVWRWTSTSNFYELVLQDSGAATSPNILQIFKTVAGTRTQIGAATAISFTRGFPYRVRLTMVGSTITAYFDGAPVLTVTDTSLTATGGVGLSTATNGASSAATYYQFRVQPLGQSVVGQSLYTRVRLTTTDPTVTPQVTDLTASVRSPSIVTGAFIADTQYSVYSGNKVTNGGALDDQASRSSTIWDIDDNLELTFLDMLSTPSPFVITGDIMLDTAQITVVKSGDNYRNVQFITGLTDTLARVESNIGDGSKQSFPTIYPIQNISKILVNGAPATFGVQDIDTGRDFYYKVGDLAYSQDASATTLSNTQTVKIFYDGLVSNVSVELRDDDQIILLASIDGTDGRVEEAEDGGGVSVLAGMQLSVARLDQFARVARTLTFTSKRDGLAPAMLAPVFLSQFRLHDVPFLLTEVDTSTDATSQVEHAVTATDGSDVTTWGRYLLDKRKAL